MKKYIGILTLAFSVSSGVWSAPTLNGYCLSTITVRYVVTPKEKHAKLNAMMTKIVSPNVTITTSLV